MNQGKSERRDFGWLSACSPSGCGCMKGLPNTGFPPSREPSTDPRPRIHPALFLMARNSVQLALSLGLGPLTRLVLRDRDLGFAFRSLMLISAPPKQRARLS